MLSLTLLFLGAVVMAASAWAGLFSPRRWQALPRRLDHASPDSGRLVWMCLGVMFLTLAASALAAASVREAAAGEPLREMAGPMLAGYSIASLVGLVGMWLLGRSAIRTGGGTSSRLPDWAVLRLSGVPPALIWTVGAICPVLALGVISAMAHRLMTGQPPAPIAHPTLAMLAENPGQPWSLALIAGAVLGAPLVEEIVFRGALQTAVLRGTGSRAAAIAVATGAFLLVHLGLPAHTLLPLGGLSVALGLAYERTRSLMVPVAMHAGYNALNVAMVVWG